MEIFTIYLQVVGKFAFLEELYCYMVICLFRKGVTNVITMMWMIIESSFNFEFFTLICNDFIREPITKISSMLRKTPLFCSFSGNSQSERFPIALIGHP